MERGRGVVSLIPVEASIDAEDVLIGLNHNDESILGFITQMLEEAQSSDLRERLADRLASWDEDHAVEPTESEGGVDNVTPIQEGGEDGGEQTP